MPGGNVNKPQSGTYGEGADLARLKQQLPTGVVGQAPSAPPAPTMPTQPLAQPGQPGRPPAAPPGVPSVLMQPSSPPAAPGPPPIGAGAVTPGQNTIALLDMLSTSTEVSAATREWAKTVLNMVFGAQSNGA